MQFFDKKLKTFFSQKKILRHLVKSKKPIFLDIGGNTGEAVKLYKKLFPNCEVNTVEPNKESFKLNKIKTKKFKKINYHNFALSNYNGYSYLNVNLENNRQGSSLFDFSKNSLAMKKNHHPKENLEKRNFTKEYVKIKKSNDFLSKFKKVDFFKIDTGGSELNIIKDISKKNFKKIKVLQIEIFLDDVYKFNAQKNFNKIFNILLENNFMIYDFSHIYKNLKIQRTLWFDIIFVNKNLKNLL